MVAKVSVNGYLASGNNIWWHLKASSKKHGNGNVEILTLTLQSLLLFMADMVMHERKKMYGLLRSVTNVLIRQSEIIFGKTYFTNFTDLDKTAFIKEVSLFLKSKLFYKKGGDRIK